MERYRQRLTILLRNQLVERQLWIAEHQARIYERQAREIFLDRDDLKSTGAIALIRAVEDYRPERGASFDSFCTDQVRWSIFHELTAYNWLPAHVQDKRRRLRKVLADMTVRLGRPPDDEELAGELGMPQKEYLKFIHQTHIGNCFPVGENDKDRRHKTPYQAARDKDLVDLIVKAIGRMERRSRTIFILYYGKNKKLRHIGRVMGVTGERIRQMLRDSIGELRYKFDQERQLAPGLS